MPKSKTPHSILERAKGITSKRANVVVQHIIKNGYVTTEELKDIYGLSHPPRAARDVREQGIPLVTFKFKLNDGRIVGAYKFPNEDELDKFSSVDVWDTQKIGSIKTFISSIEKLNLDKPSEYSYFFRGHSDHIGYKLQPSIFRESRWVENEHIMFREVIIKCPSDFSSSMSTFEKLVKMQHYSLPTRLLDITENPLVALYFACTSNPEKDGEVIVFKIPKSDVKYYDSDTVSVISNISKRPPEFDISDIKHLERDAFNEQESIKYLLHEVKEEKPYFDPKVKAEHLESVVCVKPKLDNPRVIRQDGAFFVFGMNGDKKNQANIPNEYLVTSESLKLIINKSGKEKLRQQLASLGISDAKMFPEIDSVSNYLKSNFKVS